MKRTITWLVIAGIAFGIAWSLTGCVSNTDRAGAGVMVGGNDTDPIYEYRYSDNVRCYVYDFKAISCLQVK
jgi:hypothetical protein